MSSFLRRMMMAAAMRKDGNLMGEEFCDADGKAIVTTLADKSVLCWRNVCKFIQMNYTIAGLNVYTNGTEFKASGTATARGDINLFMGFFHENYKYLFSFYFDNEQTVGLGQYGPPFDVRTAMYFKVQKDEYLSGSKLIDCYAEKVDNYFRFDPKAGETFDMDSKWSILVLQELLRHTQQDVSTILSKDMLFNLIWSEGTESNKSIGYTPYTSTPTPVVVSKGKLHYALTKEVRDYAASFSTTDNDVLAKLNEYCCEHPKMIEYINEWKYIIHSLGLGTGYTSWLNNDSNNGAYIDTLIVPTLEDDFCVNIKINKITNTQNFLGCRRENSGFYAFGIMSHSQGTKFSIANYGDAWNNIYDIDYNEHTIETINGIPYLDGNIAGNSYRISTNDNDKSFTLFAFKETTINKKFGYSINDFKLRNMHLLPYYDSKSKKFGMLDVAADTPKFYGAEPNTGEFTWSLTDADGNEVLSFKETDLPKCLVGNIIR